MIQHKHNKTQTKLLCEEIKRKYSIIDYAKSKGIPLIDRGSRYWILCPFHGDTDPSLSIEKNGDIELFYCFGCKKSGSIIDFYAEYEHVSIGSAIEVLGQGIEFDFDMSDLLDEFSEKDIKTSIMDMNIAISIHCFEYLSVIRSKCTDDVIDSEFDKMDLLYKNIDELMRELNEEKISGYYEQICMGNYFTERLNKLGISA